MFRPFIGIQMSFSQKFCLSLLTRSSILTNFGSFLSKVKPGIFPNGKSVPFILRVGFVSAMRVWVSFFSGENSLFNGYQYWKSWMFLIGHSEQWLRKKGCNEKNSSSWLVHPQEAYWPIALLYFCFSDPKAKQHIYHENIFFNFMQPAHTLKM